MTAYLKKPFDDADDARTRENLSHMDDARIPGGDTRPGYSRVLPEPQCDWCADNRPVWVYAARRMSTGQLLPCWRWATCERCDRMVTNGNWDQVHRRMVARFKRFFAARLSPSVPESIINEAVYSALDDFHKYAVKLDDADTNAVIAVLPGAGKSNVTR